MKINRNTISDTAWGDVSKSTLGKALAKAYASGDVTKAQIRFVYLYAPDDCFTEGDDGKAFAYSNAKLPICEIMDGEIVINRGGVQAAAGALAGARNAPDIPAAEMTAAKRRLRGLYRKMKETIPEGLKETLAQIARGAELTELVKGSLEYTKRMIADQFEDAFKTRSPYTGDLYCPWHVEDTFADHIIVKAWSNDDLMPDEYYRVAFTRDGETITFTDEADWEVVELTYQPQTTTQPVADSAPPANGKRGKRLEERNPDQVLELLEASGDGKTRRIRIKGLMRADVINGNGRLYPRPVLEAAIAEWRGHLHESAGQSKLKPLTGESDHPRDKGNTRPLYLETIARWTGIELDEGSVNVIGELILTSKGRDVETLMEAGVYPGGSVRGYYESKAEQLNGQPCERVTWCNITGADLVGDPSFDNEALLESRRQAEDNMTLEEIEKWLREHPDLLKGVVGVDEIKTMSESQIKAIETTIRTALGLDDKADIGTALKEAAEAKRALEESKQQKIIGDAIAEQTKGLPYEADITAQFVAAVTAAKPASAEAVKTLVEAKRAEYDAIVSKQRLAAKGFPGVLPTAPVLEKSLGIPDFARASFEFSEALVRAGAGVRRNWNEVKTPSELYALKCLERFDKSYGAHLRDEARRFAEAEQTSDLNLPYSVSRSIIAEALPQLVAPSVFDFGVTDQSPTRIYYENYAAETGAEPTIVGEAVTADLDAWVALDYKRVKPGTVTVAGYTENTDYLIDYANGQLMALTGGGIADGEALTVGYDYYAIRKGEMQPIARAKGQLSYITVECLADRLATQISKEAVVFSRSQIGWDAVVRTQTMLINEVKRRIDQGAIYLALSAALSVADNSGGGWVSGANTPDELAEMIGVAKVKVINRYYPVTAILLSTSLSDILANADIFSAQGSRPDSDLKAEGFVGRVKGIPCFEATEMPDTHVLALNREIVAHRVFEAMHIEGPFPSYHTDGTLIAAQQYFAEEFNASAVPVANKAAYVAIS